MMEEVLLLGLKDKQVKEACPLLVATPRCPSPTLSPLAYHPFQHWTRFPFHPWF